MHSLCGAHPDAPSATSPESPTRTRALDGKARELTGPLRESGGRAWRESPSPLVRLLIKLAVIAAILAVMGIYVMGVHVQHGNRMHPYIMDGDLLVTYKLDTYRVGDVVLYRSPLTGEPDISRIAAIGAYEIQLTDQGELLINGSVPDEKVFYRTEKLEASKIAFPYYMTPEGYFLLDDYRTQGLDSRLFGQITRDDLLGKVVYVFRRRGI